MGGCANGTPLNTAPRSSGSRRPWIEPPVTLTTGPESAAAQGLAASAHARRPTDGKDRRRFLRKTLKGKR
jgi:hypothetical protein